MTFRTAIICPLCPRPPTGGEGHNTDSLSLDAPERSKRFFLEIIHEQLPLPVPCYDLPLVTKLTLNPREANLRVFPAPLA